MLGRVSKTVKCGLLGVSEPDGVVGVQYLLTLLLKRLILLHAVQQLSQKGLVIVWHLGPRQGESAEGFEHNASINVQSDTQIRTSCSDTS